MDRIDVITALVAFLALVAVAWRNPLRNMPLWGIILLSCATYPAAKAVFAAVTPSAGSVGAWADWTFTLSVTLLFDVLLVSAYRGLKTLKNARAADRPAPTPTSSARP
ncbi:hypothetical protein [Streptomyces sp. NPDC085937]|uniref:hypothetical protein n=1 Tax=Streptomyces sp. NPDC085937 TaxID=3365742 RepID=UPI0037D8869D